MVNGTFCESKALLSLPTSRGLFKDLQDRPWQNYIHVTIVVLPALIWTAILGLLLYCCSSLMSAQKKEAIHQNETANDDTADNFGDLIAEEPVVELDVEVPVVELDVEVPVVEGGHPEEEDDEYGPIIRCECQH